MSGRRDRFRSRSRSPRRGGGGGFPGRFEGRRGGGGGGAGSQFRSGCLVYLVNMPRQLRWMDLKTLILEKAGEVNFVELLETPDGKSRGAAVVEFKDADSADRCVKTMNGLPVGDEARQMEASVIREPERFFDSLRQRTGIDFLGRGDVAKPMGPPSGPSGPYPGNRTTPQFETYGIPPQILIESRIEGPLIDRIFCANLPYTTPPSKIRDMFSLAGKVAEVDLVLDRDGKSKGRALIRYSHPVEATQAILLFNRQRYHDRTLEVKFDRMEMPRERPPGQMPAGLVSVGKGFGPNGEPDPNIVERLVRSSQGPMGGGGGMGGSMGPPYDNGAASMMGGGGLGGGMSMNNGMGGGYDRIGSSGGGALAGLGPSSGRMSPGMAAVASSGSRYLAESGFGGSSFGGDGRFADGGAFGGVGPTPGSSSRYSMEREMSKASALYDRSSGPGRGGDFGGMVGRSGSGRATGGVGATHVIIRNLPLHFSWQDLKDLARKGGDVDFVECADGVGKIRYRTATDAERAIRFLDHYNVEDRRIIVEPLD